MKAFRLDILDVSENTVVISLSEVMGDVCSLFDSSHLLSDSRNLVVCLVRLCKQSYLECNNKLFVTLINTTTKSQQIGESDRLLSPT